MSMTVSGFSTDSTIVRRPRPEQRPRSETARSSSQCGPAVIVASLHGRTGKSLLARVLAEYFLLTGTRPLLFDTDTAERTLHSCFRDDTVVIDVTLVRDQMTLFDTMAKHAPPARVVDVSHHAFRRFFRVMQDSRFGREARMCGVEPLIFYFLDRDPDAYATALALRARFEDCGLILVDNAYVGRAKEKTRRSAAYGALAGHDRTIVLPLLGRDIVDRIEDGEVSLGELMMRPLSRGDGKLVDGMDFEQRAELRNWLVKVFREISRVIRPSQAADAG